MDSSKSVQPGVRADIPKLSFSNVHIPAILRDIPTSAVMPPPARSDEGVHPLPGRGRSRPAQAAAPGGRPGSPWLAPGACACDGTIKRPNTHNTDVLEVRYPWHPWYGRQVLVQTVRGRNGLQVIRCAPLERPRCPGLEIPQWMFESAAAGMKGLADAACVPVQALRTLATLLASAPSRHVVEAQHPLCTGGDADAHASPVTGPPAGTVPTVSHHSGDPARGLPQDGTVAGPPAARACPPDRPGPRWTGGGA
jgi:hypothetical protein